MRGKLALQLDVAALAACQHGVVAHRQLVALGLGPDTIDRWARAGRLQRKHRGVYAVGHPLLSVEGGWMAAVLACGRGAVLSHASAAAAWDLRPLGAGAIHVTVPGNGGRARRAGIRLHRRRLAPADTTIERGIPITTPARTLIDLARTLKGRPLEQALDRAEHLRLLDFAEFQCRPIPSSLQAQLARYQATFTRSELEERFLALCDDHGLPRPETNCVIEGIEVDFVWRDRRLIVEVDGYAFHRSPSAFERDRERDVVLTLAGWRVLRFTYAQVTTRSDEVAWRVNRAIRG
jgi:very-short-patch-repair endonuclease